jgi:predicted TIM-barrel fold metal-dependent hydrolase
MCEELGFVGALVGNHANGKFYDDEEYCSLITLAEQLDVPDLPASHAANKGNARHRLLE